MLPSGIARDIYVIVYETPVVEDVSVIPTRATQSSAHSAQESAGSSEDFVVDVTVKVRCPTVDIGTQLASPTYSLAIWSEWDNHTVTKSFAASGADTFKVSFSLPAKAPELW